ncbi:25917_t:CDS:2, partial [Gigaspora rosea]
MLIVKDIWKNLNNKKKVVISKRKLREILLKINRKDPNTRRAKLAKGQLDQYLNRKLIEEGLSGKDLDEKKDKEYAKRLAEASKESRTLYFQEWG